MSAEPPFPFPFFAGVAVAFLGPLPIAGTSPLDEALKRDKLMEFFGLSFFGE